MRTVHKDMTKVVSPFSTSIRAQAPPFESVSVAAGAGRTDVWAKEGVDNARASSTINRFMFDKVFCVFGCWTLAQSCLKNDKIRFMFFRTLFQTDRCPECNKHRSC
jgi:hypothetical protein